MRDTVVTICGRLTADPLLRNTRDGAPFAVFRLATSSRLPVRDRPGSFEDGPPSFYEVAAFGYLGANVHKSLSKGDPVVVTGRLRVREYDRTDGSKGASASVTASAVGPDLTWGMARLTRVSRPTYGEGDPQDQPEVIGAFAQVRGEEWNVGDPSRDDFDLVGAAYDQGPSAQGGFAAEDLDDVAAQGAERIEPAA